MDKRVADVISGNGKGKDAEDIDPVGESHGELPYISSGSLD
jgi:hypothetical protein